MLHGDGLLLSAGFALINMTEILSGCLLIRYACELPIGLRSVRRLVSFIVLAGLIAPMIGASGGAALASLAFDAPYWAVWRVWWIAHAMGFLIVAPPLLCCDLGRIRALSSRAIAERVFLLLAAIVVTVALFSQSAVPGLFLIMPILILAAIRGGLFVTALSGLCVFSLGRGLYDRSERTGRRHPEHYDPRANPGPGALSRDHFGRAAACGRRNGRARTGERGSRATEQDAGNHERRPQFGDRPA